MVVLSGGALAAQTGSSRPAGAEPPGPNEVLIWAVTKTADGSVYRLRGSASLQTTEVQIWADQIDYDEATGEAQARGNVHLKSLTRGEELWADAADYSLAQDVGRFQNVRGSTPARVDPRPGLLLTDNPFYFEGRWAEKVGGRYLLYDGFLTNCRLPKPWWILKAGKFDIIPKDRALAYGATFRVRRIPLLYVPTFYESLAEQPRKSGFLTPSLGNSSRLGKMAGVGYYWAINRSFDATYRGQWYTQRGLGHHLDFRGKPTAGSEFNAVLYGLSDRGRKLDDGERRKEGGWSLAVNGRAELGRGFEARVAGNYLSSMRFRTVFNDSIDEAIGSEVHSVGYLQKIWGEIAFNLVGARLENIQTPGDYDSERKTFKPDTKVIIRKLPQAELSVRDHEWSLFGLPVWVSMESTAGLVRRDHPCSGRRNSSNAPTSSRG
jgi:LPS-assembly protein